VAASAELPAGFSSGFWLDNIVIDVTVYLPWLARRVASAGGRIEQRHTSIDDAFDAAAVVVNCSGSRAADITDDPFVEPDWGMHVIVANDLGIDHHFMEGPPGLARWVSWMPHGDLLLIGGASIVGRRYRRPDAGIADELCAAAIEALPALAEAPVIGANAGLRPRRPAVRVEHDHHARGKLIHNYGHGGLGLTLSWGTAHRVAELLEGTT
jgi:D-amino-acid oxidase